jgi:hypothetical protein
MKNLKYETFTNKWWTNLSSPLPLEVEEWFKSSYISDESFWKDDVFDLQESLLPPSQSHFGKSYDFYHDCIFRHVKTNNIAFSIVTGDKYPENWTYERIHRCVNYHVDEWAHDHLKPGDLIAIVGAPNIRFILALFTALRLGLKICYLPTNSPFLGKGQITKFLSESKPKYIATEDPSFVLNGMKSLTINEKGSDEINHTPLSFSYPESSDLQIALSVQQQEELILAPLDAHKTYLYALRDALFTFNLIEYPYWASPLSCPIRTEPCSTFMSFLSGTTRVYVADETIKKNPLVIEDARIHIMGISNDLQKLWNQGAGLPTRYLKCCYKNPVETPYQSWKPFVQLNKLEKVPQFELLMDNTLGGAILCSRPSLESFNAFLKPALGIPWYLSQLNGNGQEALTGFGIFEIKEHPGLGNYTVTQIENQLMITGVVYPTRCGVTFPIEQVEKSVAELSFVEDCMLHTISKAGTALSHSFVLLVFVDPSKEKILDADIENWKTHILKKITDSLGNGYLPDKIEFFSLMPRKNLLGIDRNWCANQYNSGLLLQKNDISQYQMLGTLKKLAQEFTSVSKKLG